MKKKKQYQIDLKIKFLFDRRNIQSIFYNLGYFFKMILKKHLKEELLHFKKNQGWKFGMTKGRKT